VFRTDDDKTLILATRRLPEQHKSWPERRERASMCGKEVVLDATPTDATLTEDVSSPQEGNADSKYEAGREVEPPQSTPASQAEPASAITEASSGESA
jgi:hypothetical protein